MAGTIVCGFTDTPGGRAAAQLASSLSKRLGLRLVVASIIDDVPPGAEKSVTGRQRRSSTEHAVATFVREAPVRNVSEVRIEVGAPTSLLAAIAAEEGADLIVVGSDTRGFRGRQLSCTLARDLEATTPVPILIAPPETRPRSAQRLAVAEAASAG